MGIINSKGQMKVQEMAFVLLALVLLAMIGFVFFIRFSQQKLVESAEDVKAKTAISLLEKLTSMSELECYGKTLCIDLDKAAAFSSSQKNENLFQNIDNVRIVRVYPSGSDIVLYNKALANSSYQTFINVCQYKQMGLDFTYNCNIAMLVAGYKA